METKFINSQDGSFENEFRDNLSKADSVDWAVAFGQMSAFEMFRDEFESFFQRGGASRAVFDLSAGITDPELIEELCTYPGDSKCKVYICETKRSGLFHHKFYSLRDAETRSVILGSANFSKKAFRVNYETGVLINGSDDEAALIEFRDYFETDIWNGVQVVDPLSDPEILELYKDFYKKSEKTGRKFGKKGLRKKIKKIYRANLDFTKVNSNVAYLLGMVCANSRRRPQINSGEIVFRFSSGVLNSGNMDEGNICARDVNTGELLGGILLPQQETQINAMEKVASELRTILYTDSEGNHLDFENRTKVDTNVYIRIKFDKKSQLWAHINTYLDESLKDGAFVSALANSLEDDTKLIEMFLRGYLLFRSRISLADRLPNGRLRIAVQVDTEAEEFGLNLRELLEGYSDGSEFSSGAERERDNMVRFYPNRNSLALFDKGWKRLMIGAFIEHNAG